jgi:uncharacterized membrane protein YecN with MAPEG domain
MLREVAESSLRWNYSLEDIIGLILVAAVVGAYSLMFAMTRRPRRGWILATCVSFILMAAMIWASPPQSRLASATIAEAGM